MATQTLTEASTSRYADANGFKIHYNEAGSGHPVIFIHGGGPGASGWSNFVRNIGPMSEHYRVLLVDMPGFGKSDPIVIGADTDRLRENARIFVDFLDALGIDKASFVGNSMGGGTSAVVAIQNPERVEKLVLMGAAGGGKSLFNPLPMEGIKALRDVYVKQTKESFREMIDLFVYDSSFVTEDLLEQRVAGLLEHPEHIDGQRRSNPVLPDLTMELGKIQAPSLVVWGRDDLFVPLDHALKFMWHIPNVRLHVFPRCGHWAQYEHADGFNRLLLEFLG